MIWDDRRIWGPIVFRNQIYGWRDVHQGRGQLARSLLSYPYPPSKQQKQQAASKQQQASSKQAATSVCPLEKMIKYMF